MNNTINAINYNCGYRVYIIRASTDFKEIISTNFNVFEKFLLEIKNNMKNNYFK